MNDKMILNELEDDELDEIAGGGTYNKKGYLKTSAFYKCDYFERENGMGEPCCGACKWHKTLLCTNPLNQRS